MLRDRIEADIKEAMRAKDTVTRDTLRLVVAALQSARNEAVKLGKMKLEDELSEEQELKALQSAVKSRRDSVEMYEQGGREDLAAKERAEIEVISRYLPRMLDEDETRAAVTAAISETGAASKQELGKVMKAVMASHKGQVDGKLVQRLAAELLA